MDHLHEWISPITDFVILFTFGSVGGIGGMFTAGKSISVFSVGDAVFRGGAFGGGSGLAALAIPGIDPGWAIAISLFVGGGWITKEWVLGKLLTLFKSDKDNGNG